MNDDIKAFVWFTGGVCLCAAGLWTVAGWLIVFPGVLLTAAGLIRRS